MAIAPETRALAATLEMACEIAGLDQSGSRLIHPYTNAVYLLPMPGPDVGAAVARVASGAYGFDAAAQGLRITHWLVDDCGFPATAPLPGCPPVQVNDAVVTFWRYYPQPVDPAPLTSTHLGDLLRRLHDLGDPPLTLPAWRPLTSLRRAAQEAQAGSSSAGSVLSEEERDWLLDEISESIDELARQEWPLGYGMLHGDAWAGNLLWDNSTRPQQAVLADWDGLCWGPREVDLIPTWHAAHRYGKGTSWVQDFVSRYGYDLSKSPAYCALMRMRDLMQLTGPMRRARKGNVYERAFRERLFGVRQPKREGTWTAL